MTDAPGRPDPNAIAGLLERLGGVATVATALGLAYTTVKSWADRNRIDPAYWSRLIIVAAARGVTLTTDELTELHTPVGADALVRRAALAGAQA
jgi:hypothetical protein